MKLNKDIFQDLEDLRKSIGASKPNIIDLRSVKHSIRNNPIEIQLEEKGQVLLSADEVEKYLSFPAGLATIGNTQVTLHIYQPFEDEEELSLPLPRGPKYHISDCETLIQMRKKNRFNRYVTTSKPTGMFIVQPYDRETNIRGEEMESSLGVCKVCLKNLNYKRYDEADRVTKNVIFSNFQLDEFFDNFKPIFRTLPLYNKENFPEGNYTKDWARISEETRDKAKWICSSCKVNLYKNRGLLHVHHRDGNRGNNKPSNLEVLCSLCHREKPFHQNMHIKKLEIEKIHLLRREQNI